MWSANVKMVWPLFVLFFWIRPQCVDISFWVWIFIGKRFARIVLIFFQGLDVMHREQFWDRSSCGQNLRSLRLLEDKSQVFEFSVRIGISGGSHKKTCLLYRLRLSGLGVSQRTNVLGLELWKSWRLVSECPKAWCLVQAESHIFRSGIHPYHMHDMLHKYHIQYIYMILYVYMDVHDISYSWFINTTDILYVQSDVKVLPLQGPKCQVKHVQVIWVSQMGAFDNLTRARAAKSLFWSTFCIFGAIYGISEASGWMG